MQKIKSKNKRTVPVPYKQKEKRESSESHNNLEKGKKQKSGNSSVKNDNQESFDNDSNQQYMRSSYQQKYYDQERSSYMQEDGLQQQQKGLDSSKRKSNHSAANHYELTFKKSNQQHQEEEQIPLEEQDTIQGQKPSYHDDYYQEESQSFQEVSYVTTKSMQKQFKNTFGNLDELIQNRQKLYQKYHSALINFHYLHAKSNKTIEQKHKEYLLSLLVQQLQKNIFINGLKLHSCRLREKKQQEDGEEIVKEEKKGKFQEIKNKNDGMKGQQKLTQQKGKTLDKSFLQQIQPKLLIFQQITYGIVRKKLFQCFDTILTMSKVNVRRKYSDDNKKQKSVNQIVNQQSMENLEDQQGSEESEMYPTLVTDRQNINFKAQTQYSGPSNSGKLKKEKGQQKPSSSKSKVTSSIHSKIHQLLDENSHQSSLHNQTQNSKQQQPSVYDEQENAEERQENEEMQGQSQQQRKLEELVDYIHQLKTQALYTDSQLKRYFIKWKIYLLELILADYQQQVGSLNQHSYEEEEEEEEEEEKEENHQVKLLPSHSGAKESYILDLKDDLFLKQLQKFQKDSHQLSKNIHDYSPSNKSSSNYADLPTDSAKQKKLILRSFLYDNYIHQFWAQLSQHLTYKKFMIATKKLREEKLKKNSLIGLRLNIAWREKQREMGEYYQEIAEQQDLTQYRTAEVFYKTNLKTKYFFEFIKTCQQVNSLKKLDLLTLKLCFLKIYNCSDFMKKKEFKIQRFFIVQKNKRMFKSFQGWKDSTVLSSNYVRLKSIRQRKDNQLIAQYFSVLQLIHKASLVQKKKATNFYKAKQIQKVFKYLNFLSKQSHEMKAKSRELKEYLIFSKGKQFCDSFQEFYGQKVLEHRMKIRSQKLFYSRQKQFLYERLQEWRNFVIKKQSYGAIEYRLLKLRQKEVKQNILGIWLDELDKRINKRDELQQSAQHKDWLVRYYGSLCEIATSGKAE